MNEEKLIKILEERFPTKKDFNNLVSKVDNLDYKVAGLETGFREFKLETYGFRKETKEEFKNIGEKLDSINHSIKELDISSKAFDKMLEQFPIERIERLEKHVSLSVFVPNVEE